MEDETPAAYDEYMDGRIKLPATISLQGMGHHRMDEIFMLHDAIEEPPFKGQVFQRLPKHMRRRQMSHFDSRLPRRLRNVISDQNKAKPPKRPSRKYRRKPQNLLHDYVRRQRNKVWLETHIWHAKRFHMEDRWGYRLPISSTNKTFRANYRASSRHCLLIDVSYYNCIELIGKEEELIAGLQLCTSTDCGLTFAAKYFRDGAREGTVTMFHPGSYPYGVIGQVSFLWKPLDGTDKRCIWLWVHPSLHYEVVACLKSIFNLSEKNMVPQNADVIKEDDSLKDENVLFKMIPTYTSSSVEMNLLKDTLNRFKLIGPLSSSVLADALQPARHVTSATRTQVETIPKKRRRVDSKNAEMAQSVEDCWKWALGHCDCNEWKENWRQQDEKFTLLSQLTSPTQFPPHVVLSLLALDPRVTRPLKRIKSVPTPSGGITVEDWSDELARSIIWNRSARDAATCNKPSTWNVDQMLSNRIVPDGSKIGAVVPLLLIQRPGCRGPDRAGYSSGWDIICPAGWGVPIWTALILRGARPGGLREKSSVDFESQVLKNELQPDSEAGRIETEALSQKKRFKYLSLPPAKRPNFIKLGIPSPFLPLWSKLIQFWNKTESDKFFVLRDKSILRRLSEAMSGQSFEDSTSELDVSHAIVPIALTCQSGAPDYLSHLYLPSTEDVTLFTRKKQPPLEIRRPDRFRATRKKLFEAHRKQLRSEGRKRKKEKKLLAEEISKQPLGQRLPYEFLIKKKNHCQTENDSFKSQMADLWLPQACDALAVMETTSRRLMGYVIKGDFGMTEAKGSALGYILLPALLQLLKLSSPLIMVRNVSELQFRFAKFRIVLD